MARFVRISILYCALMPAAATTVIQDDVTLMMQRGRGAIDGAVDVASEHAGPEGASHSHGSSNPMDMFSNFMKQLQSFMPAGGSNGMMSFGMPGMMNWWTQMGNLFSQASAMQAKNMQGGSGEAMGKMGMSMMTGGSGAAMGPMAHMSEGRRLLAEKELSASLDSTSGVMNAAQKFSERTWQILAMWPMALSALPMVQNSGNKFVDQFSQFGMRAQNQLKAAVAKGDSAREQSAEQVRDGINKMSENVLKQFHDFSTKASAGGANIGPMVMMGTATLPHLPGMKPLTDLMDNMQNMFKAGMTGPGKGPNTLGQGLTSLSDWMLKIQMQVLKTSTEQAQRNMISMVERMTAMMQNNDKMSSNPQFQMMRDHFIARMQQAANVNNGLLGQMHDWVAGGSLAMNQQFKRNFPEGEFQPSIAHLRGRLGGLTKVMNELNLQLFSISKSCRQAMLDELDAAMGLAASLAQSSPDQSMQAQVGNFVAGLEAMRNLMHKMEASQLALQEKMVAFNNDAALKVSDIIAGDAEQIQEATKMLDEMKEVVADITAQEEALHKLQETHRSVMKHEGNEALAALGNSVNNIVQFDTSMGDIFKMQQPMAALNKMMMDGYAQASKMTQQFMGQMDQTVQHIEDIEHHAVTDVVQANNILEGQRNFISFVAGQFAQALTTWEQTFAKGNPLAQQFVSNIRQALSVMQQLAMQMASSAHQMTEKAGIAWKMPGMDGMMKLPSMTNMNMMKPPGADDMMKNYQNMMTAGMNNAQSMMKQGMDNYQNMMKNMASGAGGSSGSGFPDMMKQGMEMQQNMMKNMGGFSGIQNMMKQGMDNYQNMMKNMASGAGGSSGSGFPDIMKQGMEMQQNMMMKNMGGSSGIQNWMKQGMDKAAAKGQ